jgi:hypothetical protein
MRPANLERLRVAPATTTTSDGVRRDQQIKKKNSLSFSPKKPVFYKTTKPDRYTQSIAAHSGCFFFFFRLSCFRTRIFSHKKSVIVG